MVGATRVNDKARFVECQQVWICVSMFGIFQRVKGIISGVYHDRYSVYRSDHRQYIDFPLSGKQGEGEGAAWLEPRV